FRPNHGRAKHRICKTGQRFSFCTENKKATRKQLCDDLVVGHVCVFVRCNGACVVTAKLSEVRANRSAVTISGMSVPFGAQKAFHRTRTTEMRRCQNPGLCHENPTDD